MAAELPDLLIGGDIEPLTAALIVQLIRVGALEGADVNAMARRVAAEGRDDQATALRALFLEAMIDDSPETMREGLHVVPRDGGNEPD